MSFHEITQNPPQAPVSPQHFPVFLFPDIIGDRHCLNYLAYHLQIARDNKSLIYIWHDPQPSEAGKSLATYAEFICDEIIKLLPIGPCFMGGFSFGGSLASVVAKKLAAMGRHVSLFIIDSPYLSDSQAYLQPFNERATKDLISIFSSAFILAGQYNNRKLEAPFFQEGEVQALSEETIEDQIHSLQEHFLKISSADLKDLLNQYFATISQNLFSLIRHPIEKDPSLLSKISLFLSAESLEKYGNVAKGWGTYCSNGDVHTLNGSNHLSLLKESCVANTMAAYFNNSFKAREIMVMFLKSWVNANPDLNLKQLCKEVEEPQVLPSLLAITIPTFSSDMDDHTAAMLMTPQSPARRSPASFFPLKAAACGEVAKADDDMPGLNPFKNQQQQENRFFQLKAAPRTRGKERKQDAGLLNSVLSFPVYNKTYKT